MNNISDLFWSASLAELKKGYLFQPQSEKFVCLICGAEFEQGRVYPNDNAYYTAEKATTIHIAKVHQSMFHFLMEMNKKYTGLTDHQKTLLYYFFAGLSDKEIAAKLENGNTSTIRAQRFTFREKAKQARVFLAIMELLEESAVRSETNLNKEEQLTEIPRTVTILDERFAITAAEYEQVVKNYFKQGTNGPIGNFPKKEKRKVVILNELAKRFEPGRQYTEKEINEILKQAYDDYVTLRRYLIEYGFLDRVPDGSSYWVKL